MHIIYLVSTVEDGSYTGMVWNVQELCQVFQLYKAILVVVHGYESTQPFLHGREVHVQISVGFLVDHHPTVKGKVCLTSRLHEEEIFKRMTGCWNI